MNLKTCVVLTKPVEGSYNSRLHLINYEKDSELVSSFKSLCETHKEDIGLMEHDKTCYEFLHSNRQGILEFSAKIAEHLRYHSLLCN